MTHPPLRTVFLGSGSSGNCTVVTSGTDVVMIDCGFSAREVATRMRSADLDPAAVKAIFVTHEHGDHVRGVDVFARRYAPGCVVYGTPGTLTAARLKECRIDTAALVPGSPTSIGRISVLAFRTSHDAAEPVGYRVDAEATSFGLMTDTGVFSGEAAEALASVDVLGIEVNHDLRMLETGPYPAYLKRRIRSARGHLSNADAAEALERLATDRLTRVIALHRSRTNNTAALAEAAVRDRLSRMGHPAKAFVARQDGVTDPDPAQGSLFGD